MMNGKQINGLCKVLNVFQNNVCVMGNAVIDPAHVMMCRVSQTPIFGVEAEGVLDIKAILKLKIEDEDFDVSVENGRYILKNEKRTYSFLVSDETPLNPKMPKFDTQCTVETDAKTLLKAVEKCEIVSDHAILEGGRLTAEGEVMKASVVLGKDDGSGCRTIYSVDCLKRIAKVTTGKVKLEYNEDFPVKIKWFDGYYDYEVMLAPRIETEAKE